MPLPVGPPPGNKNVPDTSNPGINYNKANNAAPVKPRQRTEANPTNNRGVPGNLAGATRTTRPQRPSNSNNNVNMNKNSAPSASNRNVTEHKNYFSEIINGEEWRTDKLTNRRYKVLPPTEWNEDGTSVCHMDDVDGLTDLNAAASTYLSHLQVAPTKRELSEMRAENVAKRKAKEQ